MAIKISQVTVIEDNRNVANVENVSANGRVYVGGGLMENANVISSGYTVTGRNALSAGPVTIQTGTTITIASGSRWVII